MQVKLFSFSKNVNSTAIPSGGITFECQIKGPCSVMNPVLIFSSMDYIAYNYCYIPSWGRYYFINEWSFQDGRAAASLNCDVLASHKGAIGASYNYILRAASQKNENVIDMLYPMTCEVETITYADVAGDLSWSGQVANGSYVVGIVNGDTGSTGSVSYYVMTQGQFRSLCASMFSAPSSWLGIPEDVLDEGLQKALVNPFQYIVSVYWFPFTVSHGSAVSSILFGWWAFSQNAYNLSSNGYSAFRLKFGVPKHPQAADRGAYLNGAPFSSYQLFIAGFGTFEIPADKMINQSELNCTMVVDSITGKAIVQVYADNPANPILTRDAQIGVPIQINGITTAQGAGSTLMHFASGLATSVLDLFGLSRESAAEIGSGLATNYTSLSSNGTNGCTSQFYYPPFFQGNFKKVVDALPAKYGYPLCEAKTINSLGGYVQCDKATLKDSGGNSAFTGTENEYNSIITFMNGGFYYD